MLIFLLRSYAETHLLISTPMIPNRKAMFVKYDKKIREESGLGDISFYLDLDVPFGIEEGSDDHGGSRQYLLEDLAVGAAYLFPMLDVSEEHASAIDMLKAGSCFFKGSLDDVERDSCLLGRRCVLCPDGTGAGDVDMVAETYGSGETDDGLVGRGAGDIGAGHDGSLNSSLTSLRPTKAANSAKSPWVTHNRVIHFRET